MPALLTRQSIRTQLMVLVPAIVAPVVAGLAVMLISQLQDTRRSQSLGLQLVSDLCQQLGAQLEVGRLPSAVFSLEFKPDRPVETATAS